VLAPAQLLLTAAVPPRTGRNCCCITISSCAAAHSFLGRTLCSLCTCC
jgi:hypothetical protein